VGNSEDNDIACLDDVPDRERKARQQEPADADAFADSGPEGPRRRALDDGVQRALHLVGEIEAKPGKLLPLPVTGRGEVRGGAWVEADPHALPAAPAVDQAGANHRPVLGSDRTRTHLAGALFKLSNPGLGSAGVGAVVQAQQEFVSKPRSLPDGEGEGGREDAGGLRRHGLQYSWDG
jgi:hypothetical protein